MSCNVAMDTAGCIKHRLLLETQTEAYFKSLSDEAVREENEIEDALSQALKEIDFDGE